MRFLVDSMLPPQVAQLLREGGHDAVTPRDLGAHNLGDDELIRLSAADERVIVTENASDFAQSRSCTVLLVRKSWWQAGSLAKDLATAVRRLARANPQPGRWAHWLTSDLR